MDQLKKYLFQPKTFNEIKDSAVVVIDTNVLLLAYQYRNVTFKELIKTLSGLNDSERLKIPSHVFTEFFSNRPNRIVNMIEEIKKARDSLPKIQGIKKIENSIPSLEYLKSNSSLQEQEKKLEEIQKEYNDILKTYNKNLGQLTDEIKSLYNHDPILEKYKDIFEKAYFQPDGLGTQESMLKEFRERQKDGKPPGNKDASKSTNSDGDYIIWKHILEIKGKDVVFISADNKPDWVYKDPHNNLISARRELVEEFYEASEGNTFCIVHPSTFISTYNPSVDKVVIEDLNESNQIRTIDYQGTINDIFDNWSNNYSNKFFQKVSEAHYPRKSPRLLKRTITSMIESEDADDILTSNPLKTTISIINILMKTHPDIEDELRSVEEEPNWPEELKEQTYNNIVLEALKEVISKRTDK